ncbi:phosphatase PAP2 family protein [Sporobolomyces salmoneus]|uniref:phosphatase PAP2 family protein n=1 Tax=Sporobolomyces salmoneus TaxID=183962 RepID=UPI003175EBCD
MAFPDSHNVRLIKRQFRFISPALLVDWIVVALLGLLSHYIERQWPYERPVELYLNNPDYQYAIMKEQVPSGPGSKMEIYTWYIPLTGIVLVAAARKSFHDIHHGILGLCASRAIMRLTVEFLKNQVGRLRPSFFARCNYDETTKTCLAVGEHAISLLKDGRKSFPSGHSSTSFQGLFFLTLFLAGKNGAFAISTPYPRSTPFQSRFLRLSICIAPLFLASWICITRLQDHWHHPTDVLAGGTIGSACALLSYSIYYRNPFWVSRTRTGTGGMEMFEEEESEALKELGNPRDVYGAMEKDPLGDISLGDGEEVPEGEEQT